LPSLWALVQMLQSFEFCLWSHLPPLVCSATIEDFFVLLGALI
jgi:hypothetical protein